MRSPLRGLRDHGSDHNRRLPPAATSGHRFAAEFETAKSCFPNTQPTAVPHAVTTTNGRRTAYTLLEVLLALGLSGMLMLLVYMTMQTYWNLSTAGRIDVERGQLARTLIRRMEMDIRSVTFQVAQDTASNSTEQAADEGAGNTQAGEESLTDTDIEIEGTESQLQADIHLVGTPTMLEMISLRPTRNRTGSVEDELYADIESDRRRVGYMFSASGTAGVAGLYYRNVDQQLERSLEAQGNPVDPLTQYVLLAPEIAYLEFQYYDGTTNSWVESWDSREMAGLPRAIKITFQFHGAEMASTNRLRQSRASGSTEVFQTVVHLPLSEVPLEL